MSSEEKCGFPRHLVLMIGFGLGCLFAWLCQALAGVAPEQYAEKIYLLKEEAIQHGFAHYVIVDTQTGRTEWQWTK